METCSNALLLALTNIVAIQISSSLVLWAAGFRRGSDEEVQSNVLEFLKRNLASLVVLVLLSIYLSFNFMLMLKKQIYEQQAESMISTQFNQHNNLIDTVQFDRRKEMTLIRVVLRGDIAPKPQQISALNQNWHTIHAENPVLFKCALFLCKLFKPKKVLILR